MVNIWGHLNSLPVVCLEPTCHLKWHVSYICPQPPVLHAVKWPLSSSSVIWFAHLFSYHKVLMCLEKIVIHVTIKIVLLLFNTKATLRIKIELLLIYTKATFRIKVSCYWSIQKPHWGTPFIVLLMCKVGNDELWWPVNIMPLLLILLLLRTSYVSLNIFKEKQSRWGYYLVLKWSGCRANSLFLTFFPQVGHLSAAEHSFSTCSSVILPVPYLHASLFDQEALKRNNTPNTCVDER